MAFDLKPDYGGESFAGTFIGYSSNGAMKFEVPKAGGGTERIAVPREAISDRSAFRGGNTSSLLEAPRPASQQTLRRLDELAIRSEGQGGANRRRVDGRREEIWFRAEDRDEALAIGKIKENVSRIDRLEPGSYTYIVKPDGSITVGRTDSIYEAGTKHIQLAGGERVGVAGELKVHTDGTVDFNVESGSFSAKIGADNDELLQLAGDVLKGASGNRAAVRPSEATNLLPTTDQAGPATRYLGREGSWGEYNRAIRDYNGNRELPVFRQ